MTKMPLTREEQSSLADYALDLLQQLAGPGNDPAQLVRNIDRRTRKEMGMPLLRALAKVAS